LLTSLANLVAAATFNATELGVTDRLRAGWALGTLTGDGEPVIRIEIRATAGAAFLAPLIDPSSRTI
jgi:hypothetical protein